MIKVWIIICLNNYRKEYLTELSVRVKDARFTFWNENVLYNCNMDRMLRM